MNQKRLYIGIFTGLAIVLTGGWLCIQYKQTVTVTEFALGTTIEITASGAAPQKAIAAAFQEVRRIEKLTSSAANSDIGRINRSAGLKPVPVTSDTLRILKFTQKYSILVYGAFDPTIAPLVELWGFGYEGPPHLPQPEQIKQLLGLVNFSQVIIDSKARTVFLPKPGMRLDLGGIAKGYAVDRIYQVLRQSGIKSALINGGTSSIRTIGQRPDHQPWRVGIGHPRNQNSLLGTLTLPNDRALGTSADTQNFFITDGVRYHHLLNPQTGYPAQEKFLVTITASTAMEADLLSTAFFVLPVEQIRQALKQLPQVKVILVDNRQQVTNLNEDHFQKE